MSRALHTGQGSHGSSIMRRVATMVVAAMVATIALANVVVIDARPAQAVGAFACADVYTQQGTAPRNTWQVDRTSGAQTSHATFSLPGSLTGSLNGLGIEDTDGDAFGDIAIGVIPANSGAPGRSIYKYSAATGQTTLLGAGMAGAPVTHGAINPANHHYYYGGFSGNSLQIYGWNTTTNTTMGLVAQGVVPNGGANGDWAFDSQGRLYVVGGGNVVGTTNVVSVINQQIPATGGATIAITGTQLANINTNGVPINGIAFAGSGYLHVASASRMYQVHPTTGAVISSVALNRTGSVDMASCASPNTVTLDKDFTDGRKAAGDQATLTISGNNIVQGNTATTTGDNPGVQAQAAGPVLVLAGQTITITESGPAASGMPNYNTSWSCVDRTTGNALASGTGTTGTFVVPTGGSKGVSAHCTFTNRAQLPQLTLEKTANKTTLVAGENVTYNFALTNTGNVPLSNIAVSDDAFTGVGALSPIACPAGSTTSLAPGATINCTATYLVQQADVDRGSVSNTATATGTPPGNTPITTPPSSVTIETDFAPEISIVKSSDTTNLVVGETATFTFVATNEGNTTLTDVAVVEGNFTGAGNLSELDCPANRTLAPGEQLICTATYLIEQSDVDAGSMSNTATATGTPPTGPPIESPPSTVAVPSIPEPSLTLVKTANAEELIAGDTVTYSFRVTNTGNVTLSDVTVAEDEFTGAGAMTSITCPSTTLAPGEAVVCTAIYVVQQTDVNAGSVANTAIATAVPPAGGTPIESPPSTVTIETIPAPSLSIVKSSTTTELVVGETVAYSFTVTNTGNLPLTDIAVTESDFSGAGSMSAIDCGNLEGLDPTESFICTATYVVQQADIDAGSITNTATATGTPPTGDPITTPPSSVTIEAVPDPSLDIVKSADVDELIVGDTVTYSFLVTNTGNVTLSGVSVVEGDFDGAEDLSAVSCPSITLAPGANMTCTAEYVVQQADVNAGSLTNSATAIGTPPTGGSQVTTPPSTVTIEQASEPALAIVKSSETSDLVLDETVAYSFVVTNTGNVTLTDVAVVEGDFTGAGTMSALSCPADRTLQPGDQLTCTATYQITQSDVDAGVMSNTATSTGVPPSGPPVDSPPSTVAVPSVPAPALTIVKTADADELVVGETVTYSFRVTNTGNVTLSDVSVVEGDFDGAGSLSAVTCPESVLAPGAFMDCTATYVVQQADVNAASVTNVATATGVPPEGGDPIESPPSSVTVETTPAPSLSIVKSSDTAELVVDETATFTFVATNTGNVTLTDVTIVEGTFTGAGDLSALDCPATRTLQPGEQLICTATYVIQQADVDAGVMSNEATATGVPPTGPPIESPPSTVEVPSDPAPAITIVKSTQTVTLVVGETVDYSFRVTNTGNVTLSDVTVVEGEFSGTATMSAIDCPQSALAPGEFIDCTASYVVQQADVDAGSVTNTATATGVPPAGGDPINSPPSSVTIESVPDPSLTLVKSASTDELVAGETVTYSFAVTNTGNVTLSDVVVVEGDFTGAGDLSAISCPSTTLAPGDVINCTATYIVQQSDVDAGSVQNTATATAVPPIGDPISTPPSSVTIEADPAPALDLVKSSDTTELVLGETVTFTFVVTNTGNVTITDAAVVEGDFTGVGNLSALDCPADRTLAPGAQLICSATYVVQQGDVDAGTLTNTATATGVPPTGPPIDSPPSEVNVPSDPMPSLTIVKSANTDALIAGETVTYSFRVTNTGNVTLADVTVVEESFTGTGAMSPVTCANTTLAPGQFVDCEATYVVEQADVDAGSLTNEATATGVPPAGGDPIKSPPSKVTIEQDPEPALTIVKSANTDELIAGETVTYSFLVTNTGNVTLSDVAVAEGDFSGAGSLSAIACPTGETVLTPGATTTCTATYVVLQADIDAGSVTNTATAAGTPPTGDPVSTPPSTVTVEAVPAPALSIVKASDTTELVLGETVTFSFVVTNTGNVTMTDVAVIEGDFTGAGTISALDCPAERTLAPGDQLICSATYVVQQADVDAGTMTNSATATGTPPDGTPIDSPPSTVEVPSDPAPAITLVKTANTAELVAGDTVTYSFRITNTGNVSLNDVGVLEDGFDGAGALSAILCPDDLTLVPGEYLDCTATYVVQQADVDANSVTNTAKATGTPPRWDPIQSPPSTVTLESVPKPALTIEKSANTDTLVAGEIVSYSFLVTNTGNVTLTNVGVVEGEFTGSGELSDVSCPATALAPGDSFECAATYVVQQSDVDAGSVFNSATAIGTPPGDVDPIQTPPSEVTLTVVAAPALSIVKSSDTTELVLGETVTFSFVVTNTGNVTMTDVAVIEGDFTGAGTISALDCQVERTLAPGDQLICSATYVVQQADVDAGTMTNSATATGTPPDGTPIDSPPSTVQVPSDPAPSLSIVKSANTTGLIVGETVTYSFVVTNTGNVSLTEVGVVEGEFTGAGDLSAVECPAGSLIPGASITCTATYVVEQADVDAGAITNTATATGVPPTGDPIDSPPSSVTIEQVPSPSLSIVKTADTAELIVGDTVTYSFLVTNTGNVTMSDIAVNEGEFTGAGALSAAECPAGALAPGASITCTATYVVEQADVDAGAITNTATATGVPPTGDPIDSPPSSVTIEQVPNPSLSIVKSADINDLVLGETVTYSFVVTNTGNVTMSDVGVVEGDFSGAGELSALTCPDNRTLAPGAQLICAATYVVQQADVDASTLTNSATATGTPPAGDPVESTPSTVLVPSQPLPAISILKSANTDELVAGETVTYTFAVTNTGNVTLTGVEINDDEFSGAGELSALACPDSASLVPGATLECTATYVVEQADVDAGIVTNTATASGKPPTGDPVDSDPSTVTIHTIAAPGLAVVKTADTKLARPGDTVTYTFVATNTGNVTITDVTVEDSEFTGTGKLSALSCAADTTLAPGESLTCTATYVVQDADVAQRTLQNTAMAIGTPVKSKDPITSDPSTVKVPVASPLPATGGALPLGIAVGGTMLLVAGAALWFARKRREQTLS